MTQQVASLFWPDSTDAQARTRCMPGGELNRGVEAARSAVRMLTMLDEVADDPDLK